jgi:hypothetical protein
MGVRLVRARCAPADSNVADEPLTCRVWDRRAESNRGAMRAPHAADDANDAAPVGRDRRSVDRHEVEDLRDAALGKEPRDEDRGVGDVELFDGARGRARSQREVAAAAVVEQ